LTFCRGDHRFGYRYFRHKAVGCKTKFSHNRGGTASTLPQRPSIKGEEYEIHSQKSCVQNTHCCVCECRACRYCLCQGTVADYDFGAFGPGYPVPGTVQIQALTFKPGDVVPFHFHKGLSYVILVKGNLTEQELEGQNACGPINQFAAGTAFVETPGRIHSVTNPGPGAAIIYWATIFPKDDPDGPTKFVDPQPNCN